MHTVHLCTKICYTKIRYLLKLCQKGITMFLFLFITFLALLSYYIKKNNKAEEKVLHDFLEKETMANHSRKQDISKLDYIIIPWDKLPANLETPSKKAFWKLKDKKVLNLTGISNTELKLQYGVSNLDTLSEYDGNFMDMVQLLPIYAKELIEQGYVSYAKELLEFGISCHADSRQIYFLLADIYKQENQTNKIAMLIEKAQTLPELTKQAVLKQLSI